MKPSNDKARVTAPEAARVLCFVFAAVLVIQAVITLLCTNYNIEVRLNFAYAVLVFLGGVILGEGGKLLATGEFTYFCIDPDIMAQKAAQHR